jgi:predicted HTH transcriptional regulator
MVRYNVVMEVAAIIILFVLSFGFIGIGFYMIYRTQKRAKVETIEQVVSTNRTIVDRSRHKLANKQKILNYINNKGRASNAELRELIGVTDRTIVRYMDELERDGKIRQIGGTGRGVVYKREFKQKKHPTKVW